MISKDKMYGVNDSKYSGIEFLESGETKFFLSGNLKAKSIGLTGSFDHLVNGPLPMIKTKKGWAIKVDLKPGEYTYKFIVDDKEVPASNNQRQKSDKTLEKSSTFFVCNHEFELNDYVESKRVFVAGNFNGWNNQELPLCLEGESWKLPIYLPDGTYAYKFIVDGNWITDPSNPILRPDGSGNYNSYISIGDKSTFKLYGNLDVSEVKLAGNFNFWNYAELQMMRTQSGWELQYALAPGIYEYKFIVENEWVTDPNNPYQIEREEGFNSVVCIKPNFVFKLAGYESANEVIVTGTFTTWDSRNFKMHKENGLWVFPIYLNEGEHLYRFIVDGEIITDPLNSKFKESEFGKKCSVLKL